MHKTIITFLEQADIKFIRFVWCSNNNVIRAKAVHKNRLDAYLTDGVNICPTQQAVSIFDGDEVVGSGIARCQDVRLLPDWDTLRLLPYALGHASVMAELFKEGKPWPCCPRHFLKRMIAAATDQGLEIMGAFENEFFLLKSSEAQSTDQNIFSGLTYSMDLQHKLINDITDALIAQGVQVELYYPESGPGHQEISVLYTKALSAADQQILFRQTVKAIAYQHKLIASFIPKLFSEFDGSGAHLHLSLWQNGKNIVPDCETAGQLSERAKCFMAGLLHHLPALMALIAPTTNSYRRIQAHLSSGAFVCWGFNNRDAAIRVPTNPSPTSPTHFELRTVDASSNPYLALGGVIAAGLDGIRRNLQLGEPIALDPGHLEELERHKRGIYRLPTHLGEAIHALEQDEVLLNALGQDLAQAYIAIKQTEWEMMKDYSLEKEVKLLLTQY
ncbi:MAG: glutamine synthetase family protein [Candidatus Parabeggiatoa sp.]|nr:glutamine synthetase family protein [Candidatus Parabeggiatoa sp.]